MSTMSLRAPFKALRSWTYTFGRKLICQMPWHKLWRRLSDRLGSSLHHRDVVSVALRRLERDLDKYGCDELIADLDREMHPQEIATAAVASRNGAPMASPAKNPDLV